MLVPQRSALYIQRSVTPQVTPCRSFNCPHAAECRTRLPVPRLQRSSHVITVRTRNVSATINAAGAATYQLHSRSTFRPALICICLSGEGRPWLATAGAPVGRLQATNVTLAMALSLESPAKKSLTMWESLRKQARKLEGEIEMKLAFLSRLCSGFDSSTEGSRAEQGASQTSIEVKGLLKRLSEVHASMEAEVMGSDVRQHTIARHKDIMQDYSQEFRRLSAQIDQAKDRADLLAGAKEITPLMGVTVQSNANALMRERNNIGSNISALDDVLAHASHIGSSLKDQRGLLDNIGTKMMTVGSKFPVVNGLLNAIRRRKSRDTIVITTVVVVCSILLLTYLVRKWF